MKIHFAVGALLAAPALATAPNQCTLRCNEVQEVRGICEYDVTVTCPVGFTGTLGFDCDPIRRALQEEEKEDKDNRNLQAATTFDIAGTLGDTFGTCFFSAVRVTGFSQTCIDSIGREFTVEVAEPESSSSSTTSKSKSKSKSSAKSSSSRRRRLTRESIPRRHRVLRMSKSTTTTELPVSVCIAT